MKRYDFYKQSDVSWIAEVPSHWKLLKLKNLFLVFSNGTILEQIKSGVTPYPVTRIETISSGSINKGKVGYVEASPILNRFLLNSGDILISHINSYERIGNNSLVLDDDYPIYHGMNLLRIRPRNNTNSQYALYFMRSPYFLEEMQKNCKPAINQVSVSSGKVKCIPITIPPLEEQEAIVTFLDSKTSKIDSYVAERERVRRA